MALAIRARAGRVSAYFCIVWRIAHIIGILQGPQAGLHSAGCFGMPLEKPAPSFGVPSIMTCMGVQLWECNT